MFNDVPEKERDKKLTDGGLDISRLENISLVNREGNAVIRRHLESLPLESFDSVSVFATLFPYLMHNVRDQTTYRLCNIDACKKLLDFSFYSTQLWSSWKPVGI